MQNKIELYDGTAWQQLFLSGGAPGLDVDDSSWTFFEYDITAYKSTATQVRFCYQIQSSGVFNRDSWNLDDVTFSENPACVN